MNPFFGKHRLPYVVIAVALGTMISRLGTSMVIPYVTILLVNIKHLSLFWAGLVMGGSYVAQAFGTSLATGLFKYTKPTNVLKSTIVLYSSLFLMMGFASQYVTDHRWIAAIFISIFMLVGVCRSLIETIGQTIISQITPNSQKHFAFSLRYTFINVGVALGPLIAITFGILNTNAAFFATAVCVLFYFFLLQSTVKITTTNSLVTDNKNFKDSFKLLFRDKKLFWFISTAFLYYVGFSQMETLFALVAFHYTASPNVFAIMYAINATCIIFLQVPIVRYIRPFNIHYVILIGLILLTTGLFGVALAGNHPMFYYGSMVLFTLGEILTLSLEGIYIDQLAPSEQKFMYFGVNNFSLTGRIVGPLLATTLCQVLGLREGLIDVALLTGIGVITILLAKRRMRLADIAIKQTAAG